MRYRKNRQGILTSEGFKLCSMGMLAGGYLSQGGGGGAGQALDTTITEAEQVVNTTSTTTPTQKTWDITAFGFDAGSDYYSYAGSFGSIGDAIYTDGDSNSRTIDSCYWVEDARGGGSGNQDVPDTLIFVLAGTSIPDTDKTFEKIIIDGVTYLRSAATDYQANVDGGTGWFWDSVAATPFTGTDPFEVWVL
jgi:hypothetical protein